MPGLGDQTHLKQEIGSREMLHDGSRIITASYSRNNLVNLVSWTSLNGTEHAGSRVRVIEFLEFLTVVGILGFPILALETSHATLSALWSKTVALVWF